MQTIQSRMSYLRNAEAGFGLLLPVFFCIYWQKSGDPVSWELRGAALAVVSFILLQGAVYWHLKSTALRERLPLPSSFFFAYGFFRAANWLLIAAIAALAATRNALPADLLWTAGLLVFAVLEQINYYYYQLMYDTGAALSYVRRNGRLRKAALGLDLVRSPRGAPTDDPVAQ